MQEHSNEIIPEIEIIPHPQPNPRHRKITYQDRKSVV